MDIWVVAAAAGAGYLAKYWQNINRDKEGTSGFNSDEPQSPSLIERIRDKTCPIKKLSRARSGNVDHSGEILAETSWIDGVVVGEVTSCSTMNHEQENVGHDGRSLPSQSTFPSDLRDGYGIDGDMSGIPEESTWTMGAPSKKSQRSKRLHLNYVKPRNSLDSCLMAQMHRERAELEEFLLTPLSSPCTPSLRPFIVSDGKRVISRPSGEFKGGLYTKGLRKADNNVVGVPYLPQIHEGSCLKQKFSYNNRMEKLHYSSNIMQFDTRAGSSGQALFCLGVSIGILSTIIANKVELEKLKISLKLSENLVDDLQEELEMKDSLIVKELVADVDTLDTHGILSGIEIANVSNQADMNILIRCGNEEPVCLEKDASISNIEAELEAELERLELSMKGSTISSKLNQAFDSEVIAEIVNGELRADSLQGMSSSEPTIDRGSHSTLTPHSTKDGVSPHELTLRLHDVIQSRLEERIMELETELAKSQNHIKKLLSERNNYPRDVSNSGSSSSRCSPRATEPIIMNLSGDALDAYNEAFEELSGLQNPEVGSSEILGNSESKQGMEDGQREEAVPISITGIPSSEDSPYDDDDDMMLIMQIVEKARQGSPAILRAQKAMVSLNRDY